MNGRNSVSYEAWSDFFCRWLQMFTEMAPKGGVLSSIGLLRRVRTSKRRRLNQGFLRPRSLLDPLLDGAARPLWQLETETEVIANLFFPSSLNLRADWCSWKNGYQLVEIAISWLYILFIYQWNATSFWPCLVCLNWNLLQFYFHNIFYIMGFELSIKRCKREILLFYETLGVLFVISVE